MRRERYNLPLKCDSLGKRGFDFTRGAALSVRSVFPAEKCHLTERVTDNKKGSGRRGGGEVGTRNIGKERKQRACGKFHSVEERWRWRELPLVEKTMELCEAFSFIAVPTRHSPTYYSFPFFSLGLSSGGHLCRLEFFVFLRSRASYPSEQSRVSAVASLCPHCVPCVERYILLMLGHSLK